MLELLLVVSPDAPCSLSGASSVETTRFVVGVAGDNGIPDAHGSGSCVVVVDMVMAWAAQFIKQVAGAMVLVVLGAPGAIVVAPRWEGPTPRDRTALTTR